MKKIFHTPIAIVVLFLCMLAPKNAKAERTKVLVILDMERDQTDLPTKDIEYLTESLYAAATHFPPHSFSVISPEKLKEIIEEHDTMKEEKLSKDAVGKMAGADLVLSGLITQREESGYTVTLKLAEVGTGRLLGLKHVKGLDISKLATNLETSTHIMLETLVEKTPVKKIDAHEPPPPRKTIQVEPDDFLIQFRTIPREAEILMDGRVICEETPCSYRVEKGRHTFRVEADLYIPKEEICTIEADRELRFELQQKRYTYFGMHDIKHAGWLATVGISPEDTDYRHITAIEGMVFTKLHPVADLGLAGSVFGYRKSPRGQSWSILSFGPAFRAGRAIISSKFHFLSFRHRARYGSTGWLPGISVRLHLPLVNKREIGDWAGMIPTPTIGVDTWLRNMEHDQTQFWIGFSWPGGPGFKTK